MSSIKKIIWAFILTAILSGSSFSQEKIGTSSALFLQINNSAQSNGMGTVSINLINEESVFTNPGATGLFHLDKFISVSLPHENDWLKLLADDTHINSYSLSTGINSDILLKDLKDIKFSISFAFALPKIDHTEIQERNYEGNGRTFDLYEEAKIYSLSMGINYYINFGIGFNYKRILSRFDLSGSSTGSYEAKGNAFDVGAIVEVPFHKLFDLSLYITSERKLNFELTPTIAFVYANLGNGPFRGNLPKMYRFGIGLKYSIKVENIRYSSINFIYEKEKDLVAEDRSINKIGVEFGLAEFFYYRLGRFKDNPPDGDVSTKGYGFSLIGLIKIFGKLNPTVQNNEISKYLVNHFNVSYDVAKWSDDNGVLDGTKFAKINFSI